MTPELRERAIRIQWLLLDVDGVLTDGSIVFGDTPFELKAFHVRDGSGLQFWRDCGRRAAIVSGRSSPVVERRARELGVDPVYLGRGDKVAALERFLADTGARREAVAAVGDDLADLPVLLSVGVGIAVADACRELREAADLVTVAPGGRGAVREAVEWLLAAQGLWDGVVARHRDRRMA